jgi:hypothetical protein
LLSKVFLYYLLLITYYLIGSVPARPFPRLTGFLPGLAGFSGNSPISGCRRKNRKNASPGKYGIPAAASGIEAPKI